MNTKQPEATNNESSTKRVSLDKEFVKDELKSKLRNESSPLVLQQLLSFDAKLLDYFILEQLLEDESLLLKLFTLEMTNACFDDNGSEEMRENYVKEIQKWELCRESALELVFTRLYSLHKDQKDLFFNCFLVVSSRVFQLGSLSLLTKLKATTFYADLQHETRHTESPASVSKIEKISIKNFYSKSSISITKLATGVTHTTSVAQSNQLEIDACLNEQFDLHLQLITKYMLSNVNKLANNFIKSPKCFETITYNQEIGKISLQVL